MRVEGGELQLSRRASNDDSKKGQQQQSSEADADRANNAQPLLFSRSTSPSPSDLSRGGVNNATVSTESSEG